MELSVETAGATPVQMGQWQTNISRSAITLSPDQVAILEGILNEKYLPSVRRRFRQQHPEGNLMMHNFKVTISLSESSWTPFKGDVRIRKMWQMPRQLEYPVDGSTNCTRDVTTPKWDPTIRAYVTNRCRPCIRGQVLT